MNPRQRKYLNAMGIEVWQERQPKDLSNSAEKTPSSPVEAPIIDRRTAPTTHQSAVTFDETQWEQHLQQVVQMDWQSLRQRVAQCTLCGLEKSRKQTVFGVGNLQADLLFVGEAPGAQEDQQGEPFVGRAGQLLNAMLQAIGMDRQQIYIANILKCRPPNNRDPLPREVSCCTPYLQRQIALLQPKLIVALGRIAAQFLLNTTTALGKLRKIQHHYGPQKTPLLVTYHPAYLLRNPRDKSKAYEDLQEMVRLLK